MDTYLFPDQFDFIYELENNVLISQIKDIKTLIMYLELENSILEKCIPIFSKKTLAYNPMLLKKYRPRKTDYTSNKGSFLHNTINKPQTQFMRLHVYQMIQEFHELVTKDTWDVENIMNEMLPMLKPSMFLRLQVLNTYMREFEIERTQQIYQINKQINILKVENKVVGNHARYIVKQRVRWMNEIQKTKNPSEILFLQIWEDNIMNITKSINQILLITSSTNVNYLTARKKYYQICEHKNVHSALDLEVMAITNILIKKDVRESDTYFKLNKHQRSSMHKTYQELNNQVNNVRTRINRQRNIIKSIKYFKQHYEEDAKKLAKKTIEQQILNDEQKYKLRIYAAPSIEMKKN